jgi:iodotyrosine deiodinase
MYLNCFTKGLAEKTKDLSIFLLHLGKKNMENHIPYKALNFGEETVRQQASAFKEYMEKRRSLRSFAERPVPQGVIEAIIMTASSAPSGAHKQPWTFCAVADRGIKHQIRLAAEAEEFENYHGRMGSEWLKDLAPFNTDWHKPFLEIAPWLIVVFKRVYETEEGKKHKNYYVNESVGIACGLLLAAIHHAGLVALTHTPSPMNFLQKILARPDNERPFLLIPVGYPAENALVPDIRRKAASEVIAWYK